MKTLRKIHNTDSCRLSAVPDSAELNKDVNIFEYSQNFAKSVMFVNKEAIRESNDDNNLIWNNLVTLN